MEVIRTEHKMSFVSIRFIVNVYFTSANNGIL